MSIISSVLQILLLVAGIVVAILLRRRDGKASALVAAGIGGQVLALLIGLSEGLLLPALVGSSSSGFSDRITTFLFMFNVVIAVVRLAGFALLVAGLLRLVRRPAAAPGWGAAR